MTHEPVWTSDGSRMSGEPLYELCAFPTIEEKIVLPMFVWHETWEVLQHYDRPIVVKELKSGLYIVIPKGAFIQPLRRHKDLDTAMMEAVLRLSQEDTGP